MVIRAAVVGLDLGDDLHYYQILLSVNHSTRSSSIVYLFSALCVHVCAALSAPKQRKTTNHQPLLQFDSTPLFPTNVFLQQPHWLLLNRLPVSIYHVNRRR